jgi:hypothetical protein
MFEVDFDYSWGTGVDPENPLGRSTKLVLLHYLLHYFSTSVGHMQEHEIANQLYCTLNFDIEIYHFL